MVPLGPLTLLNWTCATASTPPCADGSKRTRYTPCTLVPKVLAHEVPLPFTVNAGQVDRTLPLDKPRTRDHHVHVVHHQVPFLDPALLLLRQPTKNFPQVLPQFPVQRLPPALRYEHHVVLALPFRVA